MGGVFFYKNIRKVPCVGCLSRPTLYNVRMTNTPHNIDETTNHDLPGEVFPCGHYQDRWWDWNPAIIGPDAEEPVFDEDWDDEDDSWSDSDSLASCGWGTDEDYGLWE